MHSERRIARLNPAIPLQVRLTLLQCPHLLLFLQHRFGCHTLARTNTLASRLDKGDAVSGEEGEGATDLDDLATREGRKRSVWGKDRRERGETHSMT